MEIICIEKNAFETMMARFEQVAANVQAASNLYRKKETSQWCDNRDVCRILRISPRKLQSLRDSGSIPYMKINRKILYKPDDIQSLVKDMQPSA
jgi:carbamoylphosphate synthase small subunit